MKAKRKRDNGKAALKQRLTDLLHGAMGYAYPIAFDGDEFGGIAGEVGLEAMGRWFGAIRKVLLAENQKRLLEDYNFHHFDFMQTATDFLWENGVRASGPKAVPQ